MISLFESNFESARDGNEFIHSGRRGKSQDVKVETQCLRRTKFRIFHGQKLTIAFHSIVNTAFTVIIHKITILCSIFQFSTLLRLFHVFSCRRKAGSNTFPSSDLEGNDISSDEKDIENLIPIQGLTQVTECEVNFNPTCRKNLKVDCIPLDTSSQGKYNGSNLITSYESSSQLEVKSPELLHFPPIKHMAYAHGGYFGTAPFLVLDSHWMLILQTLMPDVYMELSDELRTCPIPKLIQWAENNPVVAAFGTVQSQLKDVHWNGMCFWIPILCGKFKIFLTLLLDFRPTCLKVMRIKYDSVV
jgi:hypothetical protein